MILELTRFEVNYLEGLVLASLQRHLRLDVDKGDFSKEIEVDKLLLKKLEK